MANKEEVSRLPLVFALSCLPGRQLTILIVRAQKPVLAEDAPPPYTEAVTGGGGELGSQALSGRLSALALPTLLAWPVRRGSA